MDSNPTVIVIMVQSLEELFARCSQLGSCMFLAIMSEPESLNGFKNKLISTYHLRFICFEMMVIV